MFLIIINYAVRGFIILIGVLLLSGIIFPETMSDGDRQLFQVMGAVFVLWGIYRIITYKINLSKYNRLYRKSSDEEK